MKKQQNIRFSGSGASHQNGALERALKTVVTMTRTIFMRAALKCPEDTFSTDICTMAMDYAVWFYNRIPDMQSGLSAIEICSRSRFDPVSETLINCHVWGFPTYLSEKNLYKPGVNIHKWAPRSRKKGFIWASEICIQHKLG